MIVQLELRIDEWCGVMWIGRANYRSSNKDPKYNGPLEVSFGAGSLVEAVETATDYHDAKASDILIKITDEHGSVTVYPLTDERLVWHTLRGE